MQFLKAYRCFENENVKVTIFFVLLSPSQEEKIRQGESRGEHGGSLGEGQIPSLLGRECSDLLTQV